MTTSDPSKQSRRTAVSSRASSPTRMVSNPSVATGLPRPTNFMAIQPANRCLRCWCPVPATISCLRSPEMTERRPRSYLVAQQSRAVAIDHFSSTSGSGSDTVIDMSLEGKVAVVTGATRGVGRGVGHELGRHGARVFVTGRSAPDQARLNEHVTGIRCDHRLDIEVEAAFNLVLREGNAIDILVNSVWGGYERMVEY